MSNNANQMNQVRELLFGEQIQLIDTRFKELTEKFERELAQAKDDIRAEYNEKLAVMKKTFNEANTNINTNIDANMVTRSELAQFLTDIVTGLNKAD